MYAKLSVLLASTLAMALADSPYHPIAPYHPAPAPYHAPGKTQWYLKFSERSRIENSREFLEHQYIPMSCVSNEILRNFLGKVLLFRTFLKLWSSFDFFELSHFSKNDSRTIFNLKKILNKNENDNFLKFCIAIWVDSQKKLDSCPVTK